MNRAALVDLLEDYVAAGRYLTDPAHHRDVVQLVSEVTRQPPEYFDNWVFTAKDYFRDPDGLPNLEALQTNVDLAQKLGFLRTGLRVADYADLSLVGDADKRLATAANH